MYGRKAAELLDALRQELGEVKATVNEAKPRKGSFEFNLIGDNGTGELIPVDTNMSHKILQDVQYNSHFRLQTAQVSSQTSDKPSQIILMFY